MRLYNSLDTFSAHNPVVTIGMFDGVHQGHRQLINRINEIAQKEGGESVLLTFWPHPRIFFEKENCSFKLLSALEEKQELLSKTGINSLLTLPFNAEFSKMSPYDYIKNILADGIGAKKIIIGYDHHYGFKGVGNFEYMQQVSKEFGFEVEEIPAFDINHINISSSKIRHALESGDIAKANRYLSYEYFLNGKVIEGKKIGRQLGYPTANIAVDSPYKLIPGSGVYIVEVIAENKLMQGVLSIGTNPTVDKGNTTKTIEVYIFNFDSDIYNKAIRVIFKSKIRDEKRFASLEELKAAIDSDVVIAENYFRKQ